MPEAIEQQRKLFDTALSHTPDHIYIYDRSRRFVYGNRAVLGFWRKTIDDVVGKNLTELAFRRKPWPHSGSI